MNRQCLKVLSGPWELVGGFYQAQCIMIKEGILAGSDGPQFWSGEVIKAMEGLWAGTPVALGHPYGSNGKPVSIKAAPNHVIGTVSNPRYDPATKSLRAVIKVPEGVWRVNQLGNLREVSVGVFTDSIVDNGWHNGKRFIGRTRRAVPDHLAILPEGQVGACSWESGCGVRVHASELDELKQLATMAMANLADILKGKRSDYMRDHREMGYFPSVNEETDEQILANWENCTNPNMLPPPEITALRAKHESRQQKPSTGHAAAAMYPPGVE